MVRLIDGASKALLCGGNWSSPAFVDTLIGPHDGPEGVRSGTELASLPVETRLESSIEIGLNWTPTNERRFPWEQEERSEESSLS